MYPLFQAMGLVNDDVEGCHRRPLAEPARAATRRAATRVPSSAAGPLSPIREPTRDPAADQDQEDHA